MALVSSCAQNNEVSFLGKPLSVPQEEFIRHLEDNGFVKDGGSLKGKFLDEEVFIILSDDVNGHYNKAIVSALFMDVDKANSYYQKVCKTIAQEHSNFEEQNEDSFGSKGTRFVKKEGGSISITLATEGYIGMVSIIYDVEDTDKEENNINSTNANVKTFEVNGVSFNMVLVDGGIFKMGATEEQGSNVEDDEKPVHEVNVPSFLIGQTEVTQELWEAVKGNNPSSNKHKLHPVENISWNDCVEFLDKLNALTHQNFRIPSEAEWEYAARGGKLSKGFKYSGSNNLSEVAWNADNCSSTHAVATKSPNELGIFDMSGNVYEYCADWYDENAYSSGNPKASLDENHVMRGGNHCGKPEICRVADRAYSPSPQYGEFFLGIRLALNEAQ